MDLTTMWVLGNARAVVECFWQSLLTYLPYKIGRCIKLPVSRECTVTVASFIVAVCFQFYFFLLFWLISQEWKNDHGMWQNNPGDRVLSPIEKLFGQEAFSRDFSVSCGISNAYMRIEVSGLIACAWVFLCVCVYTHTRCMDPI